jgi:hypothetical protein
MSDHARSVRRTWSCAGHGLAKALKYGSTTEQPTPEELSRACRSIEGACGERVSNADPLPRTPLDAEIGVEVQAKLS